MMTEYYVKSHEYEDDDEYMEEDKIKKINPPDLNFYPEDEMSFINWLNKKINSIAINVENYNIKILPNISKFNNLIYLNCSYNKLEILPDDLPDSLEYIDCRMNYIKSLPSKMSKSLKTLNCSYNFIEEIPDTLPNSLKKLICIKNKLIKLPNFFGVNMTYVNFKKNKNLLKEYPDLINVSDQLSYINRINEIKIKSDRINKINEKNILYEIWCKKIYHPKIVFGLE